jgi:hypothetical protein
MDLASKFTYNITFLFPIGDGLLTSLGTEINQIRILIVLIQVSFIFVMIQKEVS